MRGHVLIYGAYGFSARLILQQLAGRGLPIVLGGRDPERMAALAAETGLPARVFTLGSEAEAIAGVAGASLVLHAAGPFQKTARTMVAACLAAGADYLDLSGEWPSFADVQARDADARAADVMLMPGAAFSIVPSDCLLAHAAQTTPHTVRLRLALSRPHGMSRGSLTSALGLANQTGMVVRDGQRQSIPGGSLVRSFDFGEGQSDAVAVAWPDLVTAPCSTGVQWIETYTEAPLATRITLQMHGMVAPILEASGAHMAMAAMASLWPPSPLPQDLAAAGYTLVAEAEDRWRRSRFFRMKTDDGYSTTAKISARIIEQVAAGERRAGFTTPSSLFGTAFCEGLGCGSIEPYRPRGDGR
jgi:saccharopine dehydrogenase (NAD+, L-lysine-forming)